MSTPAIHSTNSTKTFFPAPPVIDSKLWENLTGTLTSRHSTIFKILALAAVLGLFYCARWYYNSRTENKPNTKPLTPSSTHSTLLQIKQKYLDQYSLPYGIHGQFLFAKEAHDNSHRNRYCNILPYQQNIFKFQDSSLYFNASSVLQGRAISCQGPSGIEHAHFWRMVWESKTTAIVMLTELVETSTPKCSWYLPTKTGDKLPTELSFPKDLEITVTQIDGPPKPTATSARVEFDKRLLELEYKGEKRTVVHYHFREWNDFATAQPDILAKFVKLVWEKHFNKGEPILTHCSAGIGRSGTFLAVLEAYTQLKNKPALDDLVLNIVKQLRSHDHGRWGMVQTPEQYGLIFKTLAVLDGDCAREFCV